MNTVSPPLSSLDKRCLCWSSDDITDTRNLCLLVPQPKVSLCVGSINWFKSFIRDSVLGLARALRLLSFDLVVYRRAPWHLQRETLVVIFSSWLFFSVLWLYGRSASFKMWFGYRPGWGGLEGLFPYLLRGRELTYGAFCHCSLDDSYWLGSPTAFGYRLKGVTRGGWLYAILTALIVFLIIYVAAEQPAFISKYPWCKPAIGKGLCLAGFPHLCGRRVLLLF